MSVAALIEQQYQRGNALRMNGESVMAEAVFREVLRREPSHRDAAYSLAYMLREDGRLEAAAEVVAALLEIRCGTADEALGGLAFLCECGAHKRALSIARKARDSWPEDARVHAKAGEISLALGLFEESAAAFREALDRDPGQGASWLRLAHCRRFVDCSDPDLQRFEHGWVDKRLASIAHVCTGFALGKSLDDLGDYSRAAKILREANMLARGASSWSGQYWQEFYDARMRAPHLPNIDVAPDFSPVFIVGLPRTGTTLISRALARSKDVRDRGELEWVSTLYARLSEVGKLRDAQALGAVARLIRVQMRRDDAPARLHVDKNPLNFRYLDFVAALFPNAKIIHCRRGARDTALSQWMQHFANDDLGFAYDFSSIADEDRRYRRLMAHWRSSLDIPIFDLDYEAFVFEPRAQRERLAAFLGVDIPFEAGDEQEGTVATASVWQVRQPTHTNSVGRWRHYEPFIPELAELFGDQE